MKFARLGPIGTEIPVMITDNGTYDLRSISDDINGAFFEADGISRAITALTQGSLSSLPDSTDLRIGSPIARPSAVYCIGMNYVAHAEESGSAAPALPILFLKAPNTVAGPNDAVAIPRTSVKTDWEVELGVVIGRRALYLDSPAESLKHIAGFVTTNDLSERDFQLTVSGGQWSKGKSAPGFTPTGPWLVTPEDVDYNDLRLRSWVNGETRQSSTSADMIFNIDYLIWHLSQYLALEPGDLVLTGTPQGVGLSGKFPYLSAGDTVEIEIEGLGRQTQNFVSARTPEIR